MFKKIQSQLKPHQKILAVSKKQSEEKIRTLHKLGQKDFGENYVQEALEKIETLKDLSIQWHLIGPLQSNKIKYLQDHFAYIHSVDSLKTAEAISQAAAKINYVQKIFLQINIVNEETKSGFSINDFQQQITKIMDLKNIKVVGLMTMPPLQNNPEQNRLQFRQLKGLALKYNLTELSMGTSHDFEVALEEGATWIRLGTILFGERP